EVVNRCERVLIHDVRDDAATAQGRDRAKAADDGDVSVVRSEHLTSCSVQAAFDGRHRNGIRGRNRIARCGQKIPCPIRQKHFAVWRQAREVLKKSVQFLEWKSGANGDLATDRLHRVFTATGRPGDLCELSERWKF